MSRTKLEDSTPMRISKASKHGTKEGVSKMLRFTYRMFIILFLFIHVFSTCALGNNKTVGVSSVIHVKDNLLTVKVRDISLKKVLMEIANQIPIKIDFYASADDPLITNFSSLPMEKGMARLLRDYNYTFIKGGEHEIRKVIILTNKGENQHRRMEPTIAYTEEPHSYDDSYDEDMDYQENEDMYAEDLDFQESEDMYDEDSDYHEDEVMYAEDMDFQESEDMYAEDLDYQEGEDMYAEDLDYQEGEDMYAEDLDYQESEDMYAEDLDYQESEDMYVEDSDMLEEDISERPEYSGGSYVGFN